MQRILGVVYVDGMSVFIPNNILDQTPFFNGGLCWHGNCYSQFDANAITWLAWILL